MVREFAEYRPWKTWAQFDKEIGKYVGADETNRLKQYVYIPVNLNTASDDDILSIPGAGRAWSASSSCALTLCSPAVSVSICFCWRTALAS